MYMYIHVYCTCIATRKPPMASFAINSWFSRYYCPKTTMYTINIQMYGYYCTHFTLFWIKKKFIQHTNYINLAVIQKKRTKLTHVVFNPVYPVLCVGDDRGTVLCVKLSPNLRKALKVCVCLMRVGGGGMQ